MRIMPGMCGIPTDGFFNDKQQEDLQVFYLIIKLEKDHDGMVET